MPPKKTYVDPAVVEAKKDRATLRARITTLHNAVESQCFDVKSLPSFEDLVQWTSDLSKFDEVISDNGSGAFFPKLRRIREQVDKSKADVAKPVVERGTDQLNNGSSSSTMSSQHSLQVDDTNTSSSFQQLAATESPSDVSVRDSYTPVQTPPHLALVDSSLVHHQSTSSAMTSQVSNHQQVPPVPTMVKQLGHSHQPVPSGPQQFSTQQFVPAFNQQVQQTHQYSAPQYQPAPVQVQSSGQQYQVPLYYSQQQVPTYFGQQQYGQQYGGQHMPYYQYPGGVIPYQMGPQVMPTVIQKEIDLIPFDGVPGHYQQFERLFDAVYGMNPTYTDSQKFLLFHKYVGTSGRPFLDNIDPTDPMGLQDAKEQMRETFNDPFRVRAQVREKVQALPPVKNARHTSALEKNIIASEAGLRDLVHSGATTDFIDQVLYEDIAAKLPWQMVNSYGRTNQNKSVAGLLAHAKFDLKLAKETNARTGNLNGDDQPQQKPKKDRTIMAVITDNEPSSVPAGEGKCGICDLKDHSTINCTSFTAKERKQKASERRLCFRCLRRGHNVKDCKSTYKCKKCNCEHSHVICLSSKSTSDKDSKNKPETNKQENSANADSQLMGFSNSRGEMQYFQTVLVNINGKKVRIMLDSGGGVSTILAELAQELKLQTVSKQRLFIGSAFHTGKAMSHSQVTASISSLSGDTTLDFDLNVIDSSVALKLPVVPSSVRDKLAASGFNICDINNDELDKYPVQVILGVKYYSSLWLEVEQQVGDFFAVRKSKFGYVAFGALLRDKSTDDVVYNFTSVLDHGETDSDKPASSSYEPTEFDRKIEVEYLDKFVQEKVSCDNKRYSVGLPWMEPVKLGDNRQVAMNRFRRLIISLRKNKLEEVYTSAMNEMVNNFAERAPAASTENRTYLIPHHAVLRPDKCTTQVRVVSDASSHATGQKSLNDFLFKGVIFWDAVQLLNKFRFGQSALIADITKAFLMIEVNPADRDALRFIWYDEHQQPVEYRFKVVPFGTSASPFLLFAVMYAHFQQYKVQFKDVVPLLKDNFYVDDFLRAFSAMSVAELGTIKDRAVELFKEAGMDLRKWRSNVKELDAKWAPDAPSVVKLLGYNWDTITDTLSIVYKFDPALVNDDVALTKRNYSSFLSSIYDPNGFILPFVIYLRIILRKIWQTTSGWDDPLPDHLQQEAKTAIKQTEYLQHFSVPRNVLPSQSNAELLIFCDASHQAIGAVAYARTDDATILITSKGKLARVGEERTPVLELDALFIAAKLAKQLNLIYPFTQTTILSDSLINLHRLSKEPNEMKAAIAIRIMKLRSMTSATYRHVNGKVNISDIISRGCLMSELMNNPAWLNGPAIASGTLFCEEVHVNLATVEDPIQACQCHEYRSYNQMLQVFKNIALQKLILSGTKFTQLKSLHRDDLALVLMIKLIQRSHYKSEIAELETYGSVTDFLNPLHKFDCFIDLNGIVRIRTRLSKALNFNYEQANPILLPNDCKLTRMIVEREHRRTFHAGVARTIEAIRDRYYIPRVKQLVKAVKSKCCYCIRMRAIVSDPTYGPLPSFRLDEGSPPFTNVGLDILGPLHVSMTTPGQRYVIIFTCATTRNIHLEVISNMTEQEVFHAMRSFIARFGTPHVIYSDNGTQLVSVKKKLHRFLEEVAKEENTECRLVWYLQAVTAPWRGGFYERLIRTVKDALRAVTFKRVIDDRELRTTLMEIEGRMNSRPLFSHDGVVITPSHFMFGRKLDQLPPVGNKLGSMLSRGDKIIDQFIKSQRSRNAIWSAWHSSYLLQLASFHSNPKKKGPTLTFKVGDVVLVKNHKDKQNWPLAIIEKIYIGNDGLIRSVEVRTTVRGKPETKLHAVQNLVPLECTEADGPLVGDDPAVLATILAGVITSETSRPGVLQFGTRHIEKF